MKTPHPNKKATTKKAATKKAARKKAANPTTKLDRGEAETRAKDVLRGLKKTWPDAHCELLFDSPLELLVATILSAQCTDERVNKVTRDLFVKYRTASDYANAKEGELEEDIRSTGFFNNKARSLRGMGRALVDHFGGEVPQTMEALVTVPGAARKTANVVLGSAYGIASGIVVDTHVHRLSQRLGLSSAKQATGVERDLTALFPRDEWIFIGHAIIWHGRRVCHARKPSCADCTLRAHCPSAALYETERASSGPDRRADAAPTRAPTKRPATKPRKSPPKKSVKKKVAGKKKGPARTPRTSEA